MSKSLWGKKGKEQPTEPGRAEEATAGRWPLSWVLEREEFGKERRHLGQGSGATQGTERSLTRGKPEGQGRGCTGRSPGKGERRPEGGPLPCSTVWELPRSNDWGLWGGGTSQSPLFREMMTAGKNRKDTLERGKDGTQVRGGCSCPRKR